MVTAKTIFNRIKSVNPNSSTSSSLGRYTTEFYREMAHKNRLALAQYLEQGSTALDILTSPREFLSEKQIWVIAFALLGNADYCTALEAEIAEERKEAEMEMADQRYKEEVRKAKIASNKEASKEVLAIVKSEGLLLKDYYAWLKTSSFKSQYYSKKYTEDSVRAFIETKK